VALACGAAALAGVDVDFLAVDLDHRPSGLWDAITVVDVLYLLDTDAAMAVVDTSADALAPGGVLVIKEVDVTPRYKFWPAALQEVVATKVLRITEGGALRWVPPEVYGDRMAAKGLRVEQRALHHGRVHPHHLIVGHKPL
jgi:2-polyprenyl-3-methyl-5-hydroxy-6-metoxy-1,4-benzoquinol methylase